jgi:hypothetical protein
MEIDPGSVGVSVFIIIPFSVLLLDLSPPNTTPPNCTFPVFALIHKSMMDIFYDIAVYNGQGITTRRVSLEEVRCFLLGAPDDFELAGIAVNALNHITHEPISDMTVIELGNFFTVLCDMHNWPIQPNPGLTLTVSFGMP